MADLESTSWDETDANNTARFPENQLPSTVNDGARALEGAIKREWNRSHATKTSAGASSLTFTVSYSVNPTAYVRGQHFAFRAHQPCDNAARFGISGLATKLLMKPTKAGMVTISQSDIVTGQIVHVDYDTSLDAMVISSAIPIAPGANGTVTMIIAGAGLSGGSISTTGTLALDFTELTLTTSVSLSDQLPFYDGANHRRATVADVLAPHFATQSDQETGTSNARAVTPGRQQFHQSAAKAWCMFDGSQGTATITTAVQFNVASITKIGAGRYQINFTTPFSSANYVGIAMSDSGSTLKDPATSLSTTFFPVRAQNLASTATDSIVFAVFYGDQ